jgi:hypothetical protein
MQFQLRLEGPATACADRCRTLVYAAGMIKPDTASEFEAFAARNDIRNATIVLDSEGGSVLGALALGRAIRKLKMTTMVGRVIDLPAGKSRDARASVSPRGDCESMCAFVLLAGVNRIVPAEARVRVHQIWLGDRREDAAAATYSAEDLVLVQRDIGRLAHYTVDMGGSVEMLELSLRIPPWEPMRLLTRDELRRMGFNVGDASDRADVTSSVSSSSAASLSTGTAAPRKISLASERGWSAIKASGQMVLARTHPLTIEGEDLGTLDVQFACGATPGEFRMLYRESRRAAEGEDSPAALKSVDIRIGQKLVPLSVENSALAAQGGVRESLAAGMLPATLVKAFAEGGVRSLTVTTTDDTQERTVIRIGNTGVTRNFAQLVTHCGQGRDTAQAGISTAR